MKLQKSSEQREMVKVKVIRDHWRHLRKARQVVVLDLAPRGKLTRTTQHLARRRRQQHRLQEVVQKKMMMMRMTTQIDELWTTSLIDLDLRNSLICLFPLSVYDAMTALFFACFLLSVYFISDLGKDFA
jgi:hypothetical protein